MPLCRRNLKCITALSFIVKIVLNEKSDEKILRGCQHHVFYQQIRMQRKSVCIKILFQILFSFRQFNQTWALASQKIRSSRVKLLSWITSWKMWRRSTLLRSAESYRPGEIIQMHIPNKGIPLAFTWLDSNETSLQWVEFVSVWSFTYLRREMHQGLLIHSWRNKLANYQKSVFWTSIRTGDLSLFQCKFVVMLWKELHFLQHILETKWLFHYTVRQFYKCTYSAWEAV